MLGSLQKDESKPILARFLKALLQGDTTYMTHFRTLSSANKGYAQTRRPGALEVASARTISIRSNGAKPSETLAIGDCIADNVTFLERFGTIAGAVRSTLGCSVRIPTAGNLIVNAIGICTDLIVERTRSRGRWT